MTEGQCEEDEKPSLSGQNGWRSRGDCSKPGWRVMWSPSMLLERLSCYGRRGEEYAGKVGRILSVAGP